MGKAEGLTSCLRPTTTDHMILALWFSLQESHVLYLENGGDDTIYQ